MGIRAQGNSKAKYNSVWEQTGLGAAGAPPPGQTNIQATGGNIDGAAVSYTHLRAHET